MGKCYLGAASTRSIALNPSEIAARVKVKVKKLWWLPYGKVHSKITENWKKKKFNPRNVHDFGKWLANNSFVGSRIKGKK